MGCTYELHQDLTELTEYSSYEYSKREKQRVNLLGKQSNSCCLNYLLSLYFTISRNPLLYIILQHVHIIRHGDMMTKLNYKKEKISATVSPYLRKRTLGYVDEGILFSGISDFVSTALAMLIENLDYERELELIKSEDMERLRGTKYPPRNNLSTYLHCT